MGNEVLKTEIESTIIEDRVFFPGYSTLLNKESQNTNPPNPNKKVIDKEHITISKVFKATLDEEEAEKFTFLDEHLGMLLSLEKEPKFRIKDLDDIIRYLIKDKSNPLPYLFDVFHRSITMIEIKFRKEYDNSYKQIHRIIANYIGTLLTDPSIFNKSISISEKNEAVNKYLKDCDLDELGFFLYDLYLGINNNEEGLKYFFGLYFNYLHAENKEKFQSLFVGNIKDSLSKNLCILKSLFIAFPQLIKIFVDLSLKMGGDVGIAFQKNNFICKYIDVSPIETSLSNMRTVINLNRSKREADIAIDKYINKLNNYLNEVADFLVVMYIKDPFYSVLEWAFKLVKLNLEKLKMYKNDSILTTNGFFLNIIYILNKIFFKEYECDIQNEEKYSNFIFKVVGKIDALFTLTENNIPFSKFDRANPEIVNAVINDPNSDSKELIPPTFSIYTKLFFLEEVFLFYVLKNFMTQVEILSRKHKAKVDETNGNLKDPDLQNIIILEQILLIYLRNKEFYKGMLRFSEVSTFLIFSLNNKKYSQYKFSNNPKEINYKEFLDDFYYHINFDDNFAISLLPQFIYQNLITISKFTKIFHEDSLIDNIYCTKALIYFSLIFSCQNNLIRNPHFRMEIFDIMVFLFNRNDKDKNSRTSSIFKLLNEKFIKESLMVSILRVFVDAERLGTSNQFYEKFSVRAKILMLIDNINKGYGHIFEENIRAYTEKYPEESKKMVNNLLNDLTYLNDEVIEKLKAIKIYEDLIADKERYEHMSEENRKFEETKFNETDRIVRAEIKLFNVSFKFLVSMCKILQLFFIKNGFVSTLANFLGYSLNIFASPLGNDLKLKNLSDYEFNPKFVLGSLLSIYGAFHDSIEFIECVVKDERSYKYANFERAKNLVENSGKIQIDNIDFNNFLLLFDKLKTEEEKVKSEQLDFSDAPDEFCDQITTELMLDPVQLPKSHVILDRKTIETQLLSDPVDPYNRTPLTKDMLIPCPELKAKIEEYINKKKAEKANKVKNEENKK